VVLPLPYCDREDRPIRCAAAGHEFFEIPFIEGFDDAITKDKARTQDRSIAEASMRAIEQTITQIGAIAARNTLSETEIARFGPVFDQGMSALDSMVNWAQWRNRAVITKDE